MNISDRFDFRLFKSEQLADIAAIVYGDLNSLLKAFEMCDTRAKRKSIHPPPRVRKMLVRRFVKKVISHQKELLTRSHISKANYDLSENHSDKEAF